MSTSTSTSTSTAPAASEPELATSSIPADPTLVASAKRGAQALLAFLLVAALVGIGLLVFGLTMFPVELHPLVVLLVATFVTNSTLILGSMGAVQYNSARHAGRTGVACAVDRHGVTLTGKLIPWTKITGFGIDDSRTEAAGPGEVRLRVFTGRRNWVDLHLNMYATPDRIDEALSSIRTHAKHRNVPQERIGRN